MDYMFESVDEALEFADGRYAAVMPVDGCYLVTNWSDYYHRINEQACCLYDGGWRAEGPETFWQLIDVYQPEYNMVTCDWAGAIADKLQEIEEASIDDMRE